MKVFFDSNVFVAEALLGHAASAAIAATERAGWRIFCSEYVLDEVERVLTDYKRLPRAFGRRTRRHIKRRAQMVPTVESRHQVPTDPADGPILAAALKAGADYLVTNDNHLLALNPYESLRLLSQRTSICWSIEDYCRSTDKRSIGWPIALAQRCSFGISPPLPPAGVSARTARRSS